MPINESKVREATIDAVCEALRKEQDRLDGEDYLMDTNDCIDTIREKFATPPAQAEASTLPGEAPEPMRIKLNITEQEARDMTRVARWERESMEALEAAPPTTPAVESGEDAQAVLIRHIGINELSPTQMRVVVRAMKDFAAIDGETT